MSHPLETSGYSALERLGRGGTAEVSKVRDERTGREVAIKYPLPSAGISPVEFSSLVNREYSLIGDIDFPGLVRLLPQPENQTGCLLMELCEGPTMDRIAPVNDVSVALNLLSATALDLEFLRARGIIHGDLKPQNIFVPTDWTMLDGAQPFYVKLSDFSLGRRLDEPETARAGIGTVGYMAPETIRDSITSHRSDLFALGVIAYQLLTGRHPFLDESAEPALVNSRVQEENAKPIDEFRPDLPPGLISLVDRLMAKDATARPESALEVCQFLRKVGADYPFEKALHPKHLINNASSYDENAAVVLNVDQSYTSHLAELTGKDITRLRPILSENHRRGNLEYRDGCFVFRSRIYWPARCRRQLLRAFGDMPWSAKRAAVKAAICGNQDAVERTEIIQAKTPGDIPAALVKLLRPLLRTKTIRRLSLPLAKAAERNENPATASRLYLQAGRFEEAERCAFQEVTVLTANNENHRALHLIRKVVDYAVLSDRLFDARELLTHRGHIYKTTGEIDRAVSVYQQVIDLYDGHPSDKFLARVYNSLGDSYRLKQEAPASIETLEKALAIFEDLGEELAVSQTYNNIANVRWLEGDMPEALRIYRKALHIQRRLGAMPNVASTINNLGGLYYATGRYERARLMMQIALRLQKEIGDAGEIARTLNNLGFINHVLGDPQKAISHLSESLEINRRIGSRKEMMFNLENLTDILIETGRLRQSLDYLKEGMELSSALADKPHIATFQLRMGMALTHLGRFSEADAALKRAEQLIGEIDDALMAQLCTMAEATLRYQVGDNKKACERAWQVMEDTGKIGQADIQVKALILLTRLSDDPTHSDLLMKIIREKKLERDRLVSRFSRAERYLQKDDMEGAAEVVGDVLLAPLTWHEHIELPGMCNLAAEILIGAGRNDDAARCLDRAYELANANGLKPELITCLTLRGRLDHQQGNYEECFARYKQALGLCRSVAANIDNDTDRNRYQSKRTIKFLTKEIGRLRASLTVKERAG